LVTLDGHTDERGTREYNLALGEQRADTVRRFLAAEGVPDRQIHTMSYGEELPADPGHSEAAWALNRRVELVY
jgi:peptidoglycan-associated lipoprotein